MPFDEMARSFHNEPGQHPSFQRESVGEGLHDGSRHDVVVQPWGSVGQRARGSRIPIEMETPIHRDEDVTNQMALIDHHHAAHVCSSAYQTLTHTHDLHPARGADRPVTGAVLTGQASHPSVNTERLERHDHD